MGLELMYDLLAVIFQLAEIDRTALTGMTKYFLLVRNFHTVSNSRGTTGETTLLPLLPRRVLYDGIKNCLSSLT